MLGVFAETTTGIIPAQGTAGYQRLRYATKLRGDTIVLGRTACSDSGKSRPAILAPSNCTRGIGYAKISHHVTGNRIETSRVLDAA